MSKSEMSEEEAVIDWFIRHSVSSISPGQSIQLLEIAGKVRDEIAKDPTTPRAIRAYAIALDIVAKAGHIQQGVVIAQLKRMMSGAKQ